jgi:xanthine/uracil/vitamin C permease (AzgA family)
VLIFLIIDFFGGIGKFIGLTAATNLQSNGKVRNIQKAPYVDGAGTVFGAVTSTSDAVYLEVRKYLHWNSMVEAVAAEGPALVDRHVDYIAFTIVRSVGRCSVWVDFMDDIAGLASVCV